MTSAMWVRNSCRFFAVALIAMSLLCVGAGCTCLFGAASWSYVHCKGGAWAVTKWGLERTASGEIGDAQLALLDDVVESDPGEAQAAADGYVQIYRKLVNGWPGLEFVSGRAIVHDDSREQMVQISYKYVGNQLDYHPRNVRLTKLYYRLRPPKEDEERYRAWTLAAQGTLAPEVPFDEGDGK